MPSLRPRRLVRPPRQKRDLAQPKLSQGGIEAKPLKKVDGFTVVSRPVKLRRRPPSDTALVPAHLARVGDLLFIEEHPQVCQVVSISKEFVFIISKRTGEKFACPLNLKIELFNSDRR